MKTVHAAGLRESYAVPKGAGGGALQETGRCP